MYKCFGGRNNAGGTLVFLNRHNYTKLGEGCCLSTGGGVFTHLGGGKNITGREETVYRISPVTVY